MKTIVFIFFSFFLLNSRILGAQDFIELKTDKLIKHKIYLPSHLNAQSSVVLMLHGCTQDAASFAEITAIKKWVKEYNFIAIFPEQSKFKNPFDCWNWFTPKNLNHRGEIKKIMDLTNQVIKIYHLESDQFFVAGFSAGAAMSNIIGNCYPNRVKAMASQDGAHYKAFNLKHPFKMLKNGSSLSPEDAAFKGLECALKKTTQHFKPLPAILLHSDKSSVISTKYTEKMFQQLYSFNDLLDNGNLDDSLELTNEEFLDNKNQLDYKVSRLKDKEGKILIEKNVIYNSKHSWSGGKEGYRFSNPKGPSSSDLIFNFFKQYGL